MHKALTLIGNVSCYRPQTQEIITNGFKVSVTASIVALTNFYLDTSFVYTVYCVLSLGTQVTFVLRKVTKVMDVVV